MPDNASSSLTFRDYTFEPAAGSGNFSQQFTIASDITSFVVFVFAEPPFDFVVLAPDGTSIPQNAIKNLYSGVIRGDDGTSLRFQEVSGGQRTNAVQVPVQATSAALSGVWTCNLHAAFPGEGSPRLRVVQRSYTAWGTSTYTLRVKPVVYTTNLANIDAKKRYLKSTMEQLAMVFRGAGIRLDTVDPIVGDSSLLASGITDKFGANDALTRVVTANADWERLALLFIDNVRFTNEGAVAIAGGLPGPQGFTDEYSAVLISLSNDPTQTYYPEKMAQIVAHEIGHYLGLTHSSASFGTQLNGNVMNTTRAEIGALFNDTQKFILTAAPMVTIDGLAPAAITKLRVEITTGELGSDMNVAFKIGSSAKAEEFNLSHSFRDDFESGHTDGFDLTPTVGFTRSDLQRWWITVSPSWAAWFTDDWDLKAVKVIANDVTIYNRTLSTRLGYNYLDATSDSIPA